MTWHDQAAEGLGLKVASRFPLEQAKPQRCDGIRNRAVGQSSPGLAVGSEPTDKRLQVNPADLAQPRLRREVRQREGDEQASVLPAGGLANRSVGAGVGVSPSQSVVVQERPTSLSTSFGVAGELDLPRLDEARRRFLALAAFAAIDGDVATATPIYAWMRGAPQRL